MGKRVAIVTTTRADYDLLAPLINEINLQKDMKSILIASGNHFDEHCSYKMIGTKIDYKVPLNLAGDSPEAISNAMALLQQEFAKLFRKISTEIDLLVVLGDRFELLPIVISASMYNVGIVHLHGGETTEGAFDEVVRHSVTKFSHLHFTSSAQHRNRVIQLGEDPSTVFNVGSLGVQNIQKIERISKEDLERDLDIDLSHPHLLITLHSETLENEDYQKQMVENLLSSLSKLKGFRFIFTQGNVDQHGKVIDQKIKSYIDSNENCYFYSSLGAKRYFSLLPFMKACVGNSSSGIIEVPSFRIPVVNIGKRQQGRMGSEAIIHCSIDDIESALNRALSEDFTKECKDYDNPYEGGDVAQNIVNKLRDSSINIRKKFYDLGDI